MKIGFLANAASRHTQRWTRWMADNGHDVVLFSDEPPPLDADYTSIRVIPPDWTPWRKLVAFKFRGGTYANNWHKWIAYRDAIHAEKPDILHAMEARAYGPMLAHFPEYPRVLTPWGSDIRRLIAARATGSLTEEARLVDQALRASDIISTNAPGLEEEWSSGTGISKDRFQLFGWGVDTDIFRPPDGPRSSASARLQVLSPRLAQANYQILTIMKAWLLADAAPDASAKLRDSRLVILRGGADFASWREIAEWEDANCPETVILLDAHITADGMADVYRSAAATIMIPKADLLASSLLEALACGSIPIVNRQTCYQTVMRDIEERTGEHCVGIVAASDAPEDVARAISRWAALSGEQALSLAGHNLQQIRARHRWPDAARRMLAVYETARQRHLGLPGHP
jgi:glycosyltransferase involved in cell wall biosynthesis